MKFKEKLTLTEEPLIGSFIKTPSSQPIEILASVGFDFVVVDAEHAPFDFNDMEISILAARASHITPIVRIAELSESLIQHALDSGAEGIIAPHIDSKEKAEKLVTYSKYAFGRGFSNSSRAGDFGRISMWEHIKEIDSRVITIAMIEDEKGIQNLNDILSVDGIDAVFIGRADLCVSLNETSANSENIQKLTESIIEKAKSSQKSIFIFSNDADEIQKYFKCGVKAYIANSDQGFLRIGAQHFLNQLVKNKD